MLEFRSETIYFIVIDRFFDGDVKNNMAKDSEMFDETRTDWWKYWGGDLRGIIKKLDYLKQMGITAIWVTPIFDQIDHGIGEKGHKMASYHGYWAKDFKRIDAHLVDKDDDVKIFHSNNTVFDELIKEMHKRDMKLILDIVCNHSSPHMEGGRGELYDDGKLIASYQEDKHDWYHHLGGVENWNDPDQVQNCDLCGLSDFNEESYGYRHYIKTAMKMWLDKGVDSFRIDTVKHMPIWFWQEFTTDMLTHKPDIFMFGEWFLGGIYDSLSINFVNKSGMSMLDFSLRQAIEDVFAKNYYQGFYEIVEVLNKDGEFDSATELVTFVDNHDMARFLSVRDDGDKLRLAINFIMTARGIPCIYYGTEQYLHNDNNGGNDPFNRPMMESWNTSTPIYQDVAKLAVLRRKNPAIQKGSMFHNYVTGDIYAFSRAYMGNSCFVAINRGNEDSTTVSGISLPDGVYRDILSDREIAVENGITEVSLGRNDIQVYSFIAPSLKGDTIINFHLNGYTTGWGETIYVIGDCPELGDWNFDKALRLEYINSNTWSLDVPFDKSKNNFIHYKYFVKCGNEFIRENTIGRERVVPQKGMASWKDKWEY